MTTHLVPVIPLSIDMRLRRVLPVPEMPNIYPLSKGETQLDMDAVTQSHHNPFLSQQIQSRHVLKRRKKAHVLAEPEHQEM